MITLYWTELIEFAFVLFAMGFTAVLAIGGIYTYFNIGGE